jgi:hypothetical protein
VGALCSSDRGPLDHILSGRHPGRGYSAQAPKWESDRLAYPIGLYLCSLFAQYVCVMLAEVAAAVSEALEEDTART